MKKELFELFVETVTERIGDHIVSSTIRNATQKDVDEARALHEQGRCPHSVVFDERGLSHDFRACYTCGKGLGTI